MELKAYEVDDQPTIYAATSAEHARALYCLDTGTELEEGYPREITGEELDAEIPDLDENENPNGRMTSIREMLGAQVDPGLMAALI